MPTGWKIHPGHSVEPHPSTFAFSGFEGAQTAAALLTQWQPVGPESCWGSAVSDAWKIHPGHSVQPHPSTFAFSGFEGAQTAAALLTQWQPVGPEYCWGSAVSDACPPDGKFTQATASSPIHPRCPNGTGSADPMATRWACILLGFCRFGCVRPAPSIHLCF